MHLDKLLEYLEAQFAFARSEPGVEQPLSETNFVRFARIGGASGELVMPILGADFVAGFALGASAFRMFPLAEIGRLSFQTLKGGRLEALREVEISLGEFLARLRLPFQIQWATRGEGFRQQGVVVEVLENLLRIQIKDLEHAIAVPFASLADLEIDAVENSSD